jgi:hypothetical protein
MPVYRWSMRPWESVRRRTSCRRGLLRPHGSSGQNGDPRLNAWLTSPCSASRLVNTPVQHIAEVGQNGRRRPNDEGRRTARAAISGRFVTLTTPGRFAHDRWQSSVYLGRPRPWPCGSAQHCGGFQPGPRAQTRWRRVRRCRLTIVSLGPERRSDRRCSTGGSSSSPRRSQCVTVIVDWRLKSGNRVEPGKFPCTSRADARSSAPAPGRAG